MEDNSKTEVSIYQNNEEYENNRHADSEEVVISAFDSLNEIHNEDSDDDQQITVTKTITTYTHNSNDISSTPSEQPEEVETKNHSAETDVMDSDWRISRVVDLDGGNFLGETLETDTNEQQVNAFFTTSDVEDTDERLTMRSEEVRHAYGGGLAVAPNPSRPQDHPESDTSIENNDSDIHTEEIENGYSPPEPVHSELLHNDVLITSEVRDSDDVNDISGDVDNEFEVPDVKAASDQERSSSETEQDKDTGAMGAVREKVVEIRNQGLDYAGDAVTNKLNDISDEGLIGKAKGQIVEHNVPQVAKEKITEASDSVINDENLVDSVKEKITSSGVLGSFGVTSKDETSLKDNSSQDDNIKVENSANVESEPPVLEVDTVNALVDDDMDYQMQEVDISQSNDEDFGKVFADHRQSVREGTASPLFKQDAASRFNSTGTLNKSDSKKVMKADSEKNGSSYTVNSMPTDDERPQKGCSSILKSFFCPKRGSWQPDSCY